MNKTDIKHSIKTLPVMVMRFCNHLFEEWIIGNNTKNRSKRFDAQKQLDEGSGYSYFRFWCRNQHAVL
jgi:hypothetical protein